MTYDQWKTTNPRDYEPEEEDPASELEEAYRESFEARTEAKKLRDALSGLIGLLQLVYGRDDVSPELREVMATNHRYLEAASLIGGARLDDPKF